MARIITKDMALKIARKLHAVLDTSGRAHDLAIVSHEERIVATFGIRRGSEKDKGHDHVQRELHVSTGFAKKLAQCHLDRDDWVAALVQRGIIAGHEPADTDNDDLPDESPDRDDATNSDDRA